MTKNKFFLDVLFSDRLRNLITKEESDFHLRKTLKNGKCIPDITRRELNFQIIDGKIMPLQKDLSILQRIKENLLSRGITNKNISIVRIIFTGADELLSRICYENGPVNVLDKSFDNSHIRRSLNAEKWALGTYNFALDKWGKENVLSLIVHLDEETPHIHCNVLPIENGKFNSDKLFGLGTALGEEYLNKWNSEYFDSVGKNFE